MCGAKCIALVRTLVSSSLFAFTFDVPEEEEEGGSGN